MKSLTIASTLLATVTFASLTHAADSGTINIVGTITNATCTVNSGAFPATIDVNLGAVPAKYLGDGLAPTALDAEISLQVDCTNAGSLNTVVMKFNAAGDIDTYDGRLLKVTGGAEGVGIGVFDVNDALIALNGPAETQPVSITNNGTDSQATIKLKVGYVKTSATLVTGPAEGTLPFTLSYF